MTINARSKGQRGEREVAGILQVVVNDVYMRNGVEAPVISRNLEQSQKGGFDLVGLEWLALEVKRHEIVSLGKAGLEGWWLQCIEQASRGGIVREAVLWYRPNKQQWRIRMWGHLMVPLSGVRVRAVVDIDQRSFMTWFEHRLVAELQKNKQPGIL